VVERGKCGVPKNPVLVLGVHKPESKDLFFCHGILSGGIARRLRNSEVEGSLCFAVDVAVAFASAEC
jgi:hypothetical protein